MVPEGWRKEKLGNLVDIVSGVSPSSFRLLEEGKYPYVKVEDMNVCSKYQEKSRTYTDEEGRKVKKGAVIFPKRGAAIMNNKVRIANADLYLDSNMMSVHPKKGVSSEYLYYFLIKEKLFKIADTSTIPQINNKHINPYNVVIPPEGEQEKIAKILSTWDEAITTTEQLLVNSEQKKKALMQQLLTGKKRLPGFEGEWSSVKVADLFRRVTTRNEGQSTNVVTISGKQGLIRQQEFFKKSVASDTLDNYFLLKKGQFAYNKSYSNGYSMGAIKRLNRYSEAVVTTLYICFEIADPKVADSDYYEHFFEAGLLNHGLSKVANEGGRAHGLLNVKPSDFFSLKLPRPKLEEQQAIAKVLNTAECEINEVERGLRLLKEEKKALMQQLLTGKRRVVINDNKEVS